MKKLLSLFAVLALTNACAGGDFKSMVGINKSAPDEFHVISNPPLSVPPSFELNEPGSEQYAVQSTFSEQQARAMDSSESRFLEELTAENNKTKEMWLIDEEYKARQKKLEGSKMKRALSYLNGSGEEPVIHPELEKARISENLESGRHINDGEVKNKQRSTLNRILNN